MGATSTATTGTFFAAAALPRLGHFWWRENRYYAAEGERSGRLAGALNRLLELGNAIATNRALATVARDALGAAAPSSRTYGD